jgi:hypothetical protein
MSVAARTRSWAGRAAPRWGAPPMLVGLAGVVGFVALLVVSRHDPQNAPALRGFAVIWLLGCGGLKLLIQFSRAD